MKRFRAGPALWSYRHPLIVFLLAVALLIAGLLSAGRLDMDLPGDSGLPQILIRVYDPGVPAAWMEERVAQPVVQAMADLPRVVDVQSISAPGMVDVALFVDYGHDPQEVLRVVRARLSALRATLPATAGEPVIELRKETPVPVAELSVGSTQWSRARLQEWLAESFIPQFVDVPGYGHFDIEGGRIREISIVPNPRRLEALGLTLEDIVTALRRFETQARSTFPSRLARASAQAVGALSMRLADGDTVALAEVAEVVEAERDDDVQLHLDGVSVLHLALQRRADVSTFVAAEAFKARLAWLRANNLIPSEVQVQLLAGPLNGLKRMGRGFLTLVAGALLLVTLVSAWKGGVRLAALSTAVALLSLMAVFLVYATAGLRLNIQSLAGIALGFGGVLGLPYVAYARIAARAAPRAVAQGVRAAQRVLLDVALVAGASILPTLLFSGLLGRWLHDLVMALLVTVLAAVVVSIVLIPAFVPTATRTAVGALDHVYARVIARLRRHRRLFHVGLLALLLVIPFSLHVYRDNQRFLPPTDVEDISIAVQWPPDTTAARTAERRQQLENVVRATGDVQWQLRRSGSTGAPRLDAAVAASSETVRVHLSPPTQRARDARAWMADFDRGVMGLRAQGVLLSAELAPVTAPASGRFADPAALAAGGIVSVRVYGPERSVVQSMGARLAGVFAQQAGLRRVQVIGGEDRAESDWHIDADRAALSAIDTREIAHALQIARHGLTLGDVPDAAGQVRLRLHLTQSVLERAPGEPRLLVRGANADQPVVYLDELVQCQTWRTPPERWRERNGPMVEVRGTLASDAPVGPTVHGVRKALARMPIAPGYVRTYVGFVDNLQRVQIQAISLCALALVLALAVLAVRVPTRSQWFLALYGMIFTYGAVACVLPLSGYPLSLPGWLGGVLLATYAGILILVTLERFRRTAAPADVSQGVPLRAVLALAFCMLLCCLPFAFDLVPEFALVQPLAAILAMGIVAATLAAVFLLPVLAGPARE